MKLWGLKKNQHFLAYNSSGQEFEQHYSRAGLLLVSLELTAVNWPIGWGNSLHSHWSSSSCEMGHLGLLQSSLSCQLDRAAMVEANSASVTFTKSIAKASHIFKNKFKEWKNKLCFLVGITTKSVCKEHAYRDARNPWPYFPIYHTFSFKILLLILLQCPLLFEFLCSYQFYSLS